VPHLGIFIHPLKGDAMSKCILLCASLVLVALLPTAPAQALNDVSYLSSTGSGTACTLAAPCLFISDAVAATNSGGMVTCLGSGAIFGGTIDKSITIDCGGSTAWARNVIQINGAGIVVRIRNLTINGVNTGGTAGINAFDMAALFIENCVIMNFFQGIKFFPSAAGSKLVVTDTAVSSTGAGSTGGGIIVAPSSGGSAQVTLIRVTAGKNVFGIVADGSGSTGGINMTITDSVSTGNLNDGIIATTPAGGAPIGVYVKNTRLANNGFGIRSIGPNVTVRVDSSSVIGNTTGLSFSGGGALQSYGNNSVDANATNGAFSGPIPLK
jgi:hypothetical protein